MRRARGKQGLRRRCGDGGQETGDEVRARVSRAHPPLLAPALCTPRTQRLRIQMRNNGLSSLTDGGAAHRESGAPQQHRMQACRLMPCATSIEPTSVPNHTPATSVSGEDKQRAACTGGRRRQGAGREERWAQQLTQLQQYCGGRGRRARRQVEVADASPPGNATASPC